MFVKTEPDLRRRSFYLRKNEANHLDADIFNLLAADAVIQEVAGQDQEWQDHIRERDLPEDDTPFETVGGIFDGSSMEPVAA